MDGETTAAKSDALKRAFGLSDDDFLVFGKIFSRILDAAGMNGGHVLDEILKGASPGAALGLPKSTAQFLYARAYRWLMVGRTDKAEPLFRALTVVDAPGADNWLGLGICFRHADRLEEAEKAFAAAARLRPDWAVPHFHAAELYLRADRPADAGLALLAFEGRRDEQTPAAMVLQAERYRIALAGRPGAPAGIAR